MVGIIIEIDYHSNMIYDRLCLKEVRVKMADKKVGKVTHYYDKLGVAVVELSSGLAVGDVVKVTGHGGEFEQKIDSMQVEHKQVEKAKKGDIVGMKVDKKVKEGDELTKVKA
jgi:translation elongation factor EF-1alpha